jgi:formylglycine-generating enzyme required for sulfatase activity
MGLRCAEPGTRPIAPADIRIGLSQVPAQARTGPGLYPGLALVPAGSYRTGARGAEDALPPFVVSTPGFLVGRSEVTVGEFLAYLHSTRTTNWTSPAIVLMEGRPATLRPGDPVAHVSLEDADRYCRWLSARTGRRVRLPDEREWEIAARGGIRGAPFPWGWGDPEGRAVFRALCVQPAGRLPPNPYGLRDMVGNLAEWCASPESEGRGAIRGGSWAEKDPSFVTVHRRVSIPRGYRGADVGFRILVELSEDQPPAGSSVAMGRAARSLASSRSTVESTSRHPPAHCTGPSRSPSHAWALTAVAKGIAARPPSETTGPNARTDL